MSKEIPKVKGAGIKYDERDLGKEAQIKAKDVIKPHQFSTDWQQPEYVSLNSGNYFRLAWEAGKKFVLNYIGMSEAEDSTSLWPKILEILKSIISIFKR